MAISPLQQAEVHSQTNEPLKWKSFQVFHCQDLAGHFNDVLWLTKKTFKLSDCEKNIDDDERITNIVLSSMPVDSPAPSNVRTSADQQSSLCPVYLWDWNMWEIIYKACAVNVRNDCNHSSILQWALTGLMFHMIYLKSSLLWGRVEHFLWVQNIAKFYLWLY